MLEPGEPGLLRRGGRRAAPLSAQRRLPDGGRLLGRATSGRTSTARSSASSPTASRWTAARAPDLPLRVRPQGEAADPRHRRLAGKAQRRSPGSATTARRDGRTTGRIFDDKGRMMAIICHNTDLGDGWEREGEDEWYFQRVLREEGVPDGHQHHLLRDDALKRARRRRRLPQSSQMTSGRSTYATYRRDREHSRPRAYETERKPVEQLRASRARIERELSKVIVGQKEVDRAAALSPCSPAGTA